jgi:hypothetical protein
MHRVLMPRQMSRHGKRAITRGTLEFTLGHYLFLLLLAARNVWQLQRHDKSSNQNYHFDTIAADSVLQITNGMGLVGDSTVPSPGCKALDMSGSQFD